MIRYGGILLTLEHFCEVGKTKPGTFTNVMVLIILIHFITEKKELVFQVSISRLDPSARQICLTVQQKTGRARLKYAVANAIHYQI